MVALHDRRHRPLHPDPVAAHDRVHPLPGRVEDGDVERLGELVAQLEDVPGLDRRQQFQRLPAHRARLPGRHLAQVGPGAGRDVTADVHPAQVHVINVGAGDHVAPPPQRLVRDHRQTGDRDRAQAARQRPQCGPDLLRLGRADRRRPGRVGELLLVQRMVTAHQHQGELAVQQVDEGLDLPLGGRVVPGRQVLDGPHAGSVEPLRGGQPRAVGDLRQRRGGLLHVGRVVAGRAVRDRVLAGLRRAHELGRVPAAHGAAGRLHRDHRDAEPLENPQVGRTVAVERSIEPGRVEVEGVGVLHGELPHPQQARPRPRLIRNLVWNWYHACGSCRWEFSSWART